ncbi:MAG: class I SAM-dependent methyltransferase [Blautia sp.]
MFTILLNQAGVETIGVDGAEKMLQEARAKALQAGLVPEFRRMDCHRLDFADNTFDAVISRNLTHTLRDHKQVYKEWLRVLKPGGTLLIFDANWHLTECDEKLRAESLKRREECIRLYGDAFDKNQTTKIQRNMNGPLEVMSLEIREDRTGIWGFWRGSDTKRSPVSAVS